MNRYLADEGVFALLATNNTAAIRIQPPLVISDEDVDIILSALDAALSRLE